MRRTVVVLGVLLTAIAAGGALSGPNAGGTLVVHDMGLTWSSDSVPPPVSPLPDCVTLDNNVAVGTPANTIGRVWKVYAAFPAGSSPRLKALWFRTDFSSYCYVATGGLPNPAYDFEVVQDGWPVTSGGSCGIEFFGVKTGMVDECYWFAGYGYYSGLTWSTAPHTDPSSRVFLDDATPPQTDAIAGYSSIGFGVAGATYWPSPVGPGACCVDEVCMLISEDDCLSQLGHWLACFDSCEPYPCFLLPGACCFPNGTCIIQYYLECLAVWLGPSTTCSPNPCPPVGACCNPDGSCRFSDEVGCEAPWIWKGAGTSCSPNPCTAGACCFLAACDIGDPEWCTNHGGTYQGNGTLCDPDPCQASGVVGSDARAESWIRATPNPTSAGAALAIGGPPGAKATVAVFDAAGRLVRRVWEGRLTGSEIGLPWDGRDDSNRDVPAGVYVLRLSGLEGAASARVVIAR